MSDNDDEVPLIYTNRGNIPIDSLQYMPKWEFDPRGISFIEEYHLEGVLVKSNVHRYQYPEKNKMTLSQGDINGGNPISSVLAVLKNFTIKTN